MDGMNQNQQWNNQPTNQPYPTNPSQNPRPNWNNPVPTPMPMPQYGSVPWWQQMFNPNMMNWLNNNGQQPSQPLSNPMPTPQNQPIQNVAPSVQTMNQISSARVVSSPEDIKPSEMPVDDTIRIFMTDDLQTVYAKKWSNTGELDNMIFQRVPDKKVEISDAGASQQEISSQNDRIANLESRFEALLDATTEISNKLTKMEVNSSKTTAKKGGASNE